MPALLGGVRGRNLHHFDSVEIKNMKQIRIDSKPEKTSRGVVRDFADAVKRENPYLNLSALYWFGDTAVRFFVRAGGVGADFYRPCKYGFEKTRVTTKGIRQHKGFVERLLSEAQS